MRAAAGRRYQQLIRQGRVRVELRTADEIGEADATLDVVLAVNNVHTWPDPRAGFTELHRVLRPGGLLLSAHQKWLLGAEAALTAAVKGAGFTEIKVWSWEQPGRKAPTAVQLRARPTSPLTIAHASQADRHVAPMRLGPR